MRAKTRFFVTTLLIALGLDRLSKQWIVAHFDYGERSAVIPGLLDLTYVRNPGGAFSFFADGPLELRLLFFIGTTLVAIALLLVFFRRLEPEARLSAAALGTILGGAVGNLIDRIVYDGVIDFLDVYLWGGFTWPTFNVADSCIVVGVAFLIAETFSLERHDQADAASPETQA
ncbi:MAG: signal peptidase II [Myxococcota bacterium]